MLFLRLRLFLLAHTVVVVCQGNMDAVWGLLLHLRAAYPSAKPATHPRVPHQPGADAVSAAAALGGTGGGVVGAAATRRFGAAKLPQPPAPPLPYTVRQAWRLERSLLSWMFAIGVLRDYCKHDSASDVLATRVSHTITRAQRQLGYLATSRLSKHRCGMARCCVI